MSHIVSQYNQQQKLEATDKSGRTAQVVDIFQLLVAVNMAVQKGDGSSTHAKSGAVISLSRATNFDTEYIFVCRAHSKP